MAFKEYDRTASIQTMNARQLRLYISRGAKEANERMQTLDANKLPDAMKDIYMDVATHQGRFLQGTSNMSKAQMQEYAQKLRDFNFMDTKSQYARDREYEDNYDRYEKFIKNQKSKQGRAHWAQYLNKDGTVSKEGYQEYKEYINFVKGIMEDIQSYSYDKIKENFGISNIRKRFTEARSNSDPERVQKVEKIIADVYEKYKGKNKTTKDLNAIILREIRKLDAKPKSSKKPKKNTSGNTIKSKTGKKMKGDTVREKQGTS